MAAAAARRPEGSRRRAEQVYREAADAFAGTVTATGVWVLLGERLTETGELDRAEQVWQRARKSDRETGHRHKYNLATMRWAELLQTEGYIEEARELLEGLVAGSAPALSRTAKAILDAGDQQAVWSASPLALTAGTPASRCNGTEDVAMVADLSTGEGDERPPDQTE